VENQRQLILFVGAVNDADRDVLDRLTEAGYDVMTTEFTNDFESIYSEVCEKNVDVIVINEVATECCGGYNLLKFVTNRVDCGIVFVGRTQDIVKEVLVLELGADDYVSYPIHSGVLIARIRNILKRRMPKLFKKDEEIRYPGLVVNLSQYRAEIDGEVIKMPPKELELLYLLASNPNTVYTREKLLDMVWGYDFDVGSRTVDVHIKRLRDKIEKDSNVWQIATVWSVGYRFEFKNGYPENKTNADLMQN